MDLGIAGRSAIICASSKGLGKGCAMALAQARPVQEAAPPVQIAIYAALGMAWALPLMPLIRWMQKPDA